MDAMIKDGDVSSSRGAQPLIHKAISVGLWIIDWSIEKWMQAASWGRVYWKSDKKYSGRSRVEVVEVAQCQSYMGLISANQHSPMSF